MLEYWQKIFIAKYNTDGTISKAVSAGGTGADLAQGVDNFGDAIIATGYFQGSANFGEISLIANGHSDIFVAKWE